MIGYRQIISNVSKSTALAYFFGAVLLVGAIISGIFTRDTRWIDWHFSRLGEGGGIPSIIFNFTLIIASVIVFALARAMVKKIDETSKSTNTDLKTGRNIILWSFTWISISFLGVAVFPFDQFSAIHNMFGYSILFVLLILSVIIDKYLPMLSKGFHAYSGIVLPVTVVCYTLFAGIRVASLLQIEAVIFVMLYGWLLFFVHELSFVKTT